MKFERIAFALGLGLFAWLVHRIGLAVLARNLARVGWGFLAILALELVPLFLSTLGWRATRARLREVPLRSLFGMRLVGDAINCVAPAAVVGGEIVRGRLLARLLGPAEAMASVSLAAMAQFIAQVLFVGTGALVIPVAQLQPRLRLAGAGLLVFAALFILLVAVVGRNSRRPSRSRLLRSVDSLAGDHWPLARLWPELQTNLAAAVRGSDGNLAFSVLFFLAGWLVTVAEVFLILRLLGTPVSGAIASSVAVLMVLVEGVFFFVPARVGIEEGGLFAIFSVLGLDPVQGFSLALVRRLRELAWASVGLALLGVVNGSVRRRRSETHRSPSGFEAPSSRIAAGSSPAGPPGPSHSGSVPAR